jgi:CubicO group peptidase (beta-lactamase class C family)
MRRSAVRQVWTWERRFVAGCGALIMLGCSSGFGHARAAHVGVGRVVQDFDRLRDSLHVPGMSIAIIEDGKVVWAGGLGFADRERGRRADEHTLYPIASLTKPVAATLALQLVEEGHLRLDDPLSRYHKDFQTDRVRVRHIMTHTAAAFKPGMKPGDRYEYSGSFYGYLAAVIEQASGRAFRDLLVQKVLDSLHMTESVPGHDVLDHPSLAARYAGPLSHLAQPYANDTLASYPPRFLGSSAGLLSTVGDLAKFVLALDGDLLLRPATRELAWTPAQANDGSVLPYGLGWFVQDCGRTRLIWHYGQWPTFSGLILELPQQRVTLIALANSNGLSAPFPLADGDVTTSPFARAFLRVTSVWDGHSGGCVNEAGSRASSPHAPVRRSRVPN